MKGFDHVNIGVAQMEIYILVEMDLFFFWVLLSEKVYFTWTKVFELQRSIRQRFQMSECTTMISCGHFLSLTAFNLIALIMKRRSGSTWRSHAGSTFKNSTASVALQNQHQECDISSLLFLKANRDLRDASQPTQVVSRYSSFLPQPKTCILDRFESLICTKLPVIGGCPLIDERPFRGALLPLAWWLLGQAPASPVTPIRGLTENGWIDRWIDRVKVES